MSGAGDPSDPGAARSNSDKALHLLAFDSADLDVISAHLQDALVRVAGMTYIRSQRRFALLASRFDWLAAKAGAPERCESGLHFDHVEAVSVQGFDRRERKRLLNLLSISFAETAAPGGFVVLTFSGGAAIRLTVECLDAQMSDLGSRWKTRRKPGHDLDDDAPPR